MIQTHGLTKQFGPLTAVNGVDFQITEGQHAGIIGPNGSGKTTLFNLLTGYFLPTRGTILFEGCEITKVPIYQRVDRGMARTFQLVSVFNTMTVWENLVLSSVRFRKEKTGPFGFFFRNIRREQIRQNCFRALEEVGLLSKAGMPVSGLSYGDKRMLEIGNVLTLRPRVLLLDEPFSGLSDHEIHHVLNLIHQLKEKLTLVIIEHKISKLLGLVDRLFVLNGGNLICDGSPEEVLSNPEVRECYWGKEEEDCFR
jgi:branched-chain amino acid transport system ATP-binding protein